MQATADVRLPDYRRALGGAPTQRFAKHAGSPAARGAAALAAFVTATLLLLGAALPRVALAQPGAAERSIAEWLSRVQAAPRNHNYIGTYVVTSKDGAMSSARVWHACDARQQVERVEELTGAPRSSVRRNGELVTFLPERKLVRIEKREAVGGRFPDVLQPGDAALPSVYTAKRIGGDRIAGHDADVVHLVPQDNLRFALRMWTERRTGLLLKMQTLAASGEVLEQVAFSELQLDAPLRTGRLAQMMNPPEGWKIERMDAARTTPEAEGWTLREPVAGFDSRESFRRRSGPTGQTALHWVFSDGLASVSLFVEAFDPQRHGAEGLMAAGATHTLTRRLQDWWVTAVGEVPPQTLRTFVQALERRR